MYCNILFEIRIHHGKFTFEDLSNKLNFVPTQNYHYV